MEKGFRIATGLLLRLGSSKCIYPVSAIVALAKMLRL